MEMKKYIKKIISSDNETKKEEMIELLCEIFSEMEEDDREEIERHFYEISEGRILNEEKAKKLIEAMKPYGMKWTLDDTEGVRKQYGYENIRPVDF